MKFLSRVAVTVTTTAVALLGAPALVQADTTTTTSGDTTIINVLERAAAQGNVHWRGTLVEGWHIHFTPAQKRRLERPSNCIWADGKNYYSQFDTHHGWHPDTNMHLCRSKKSPTGWVKVGGGQSGSHCYNVASPNRVPPLPHVAQIKGPITETWSFSRYFAHLKVSEAIYLHIITDCGPAHIDTKVWAKGVVKASGLLKVFLKSKGTMSSFNAKLKTALTLSAKSSSKVQVIITCTNTPPPTPAYSCDTLHLSVNNDTRTVTVDSFSTSQSGGATFSNADIDWGDGTQPTKAINSPVGTQHTYGGTGNGPFLAKATAHFNVNGTDQSATSSGCQQAVSFTTQKPPSCSLDTVEQPNDVLWGNTRTIKVTGTCPTGAQGTLKSSANIGSVASADQSVTVSGDFTVYVHYTAPTEGTSDTFTVMFFDSSNNLIGQKSVTFGLTQPTTDPMVKAPGGHMMVA